MGGRWDAAAGRPSLSCLASLPRPVLPRAGNAGYSSGESDERRSLAAAAPAPTASAAVAATAAAEVASKRRASLEWPGRDVRRPSAKRPERRSLCPSRSVCRGRSSRTSRVLDASRVPEFESEALRLSGALPWEYRDQRGLASSAFSLSSLESRGSSPHVARRLLLPLRARLCSRRDAKLSLLGSSYRISRESRRSRNSREFLESRGSLASRALKSLEFLAFLGSLDSRETLESLGSS